MNETQTTPTTETPTSVWHPTPEGEKRTLGIAPPALPTIPKPTANKPRVEKKADAYLARLLKAIKVDADTATKTAAYTGTQFGPMKLLTTDGHRAVLVTAADGTPATIKTPAFLATRPTTRLELPPDFQPALRRMIAVAGKKPRFVVLRITPVATDGSVDLVLSAHNLAEGVEGTETVPVVGTHLRKAVVALDANYVDDVLGRWPVTLRIGGPSDPVVFENDVCAYVLMPANAPERTSKGSDPAGTEPWLQADATGTTPKRAKATAKGKKKAPTPDPDADEDGYPEVTLEVDPATAKRFEDAYSADRIADDKDKRPVQVVRYDGRLFTTVCCGGGTVEAYELVPQAAWTGETPQTYGERSKTNRRGHRFYPAMLVWYGRQRYVMSLTRYHVKANAALQPAVPETPAPKPKASLPTTKPPALKVTGELRTWRYAWVEYKTKEQVRGEVQAIDEKSARAAIRAKHGFEKWLPDRTKVELVA